MYGEVEGRLMIMPVLCNNFFFL